MKIKLIRNVIVKGEPRMAGAELDLPRPEALAYVRRKQAVPVKAKPRRATAPEAEKRGKKK